MAIEDGVATLTLCRPDIRNAWAGETAREYRWALHHCHLDPQVRVVVVSGDQDFCVGAAGVSDDSPLAFFYAQARTLRFADGPDEVHRNQIARLELAEHQPPRAAGGG